MSTPGQPGNPEDRPWNPGGGSPSSAGGPGSAGDPFAKGSSAPGGPPGYPAQPGYPSGQPGYPSNQPGYPSNQPGYPSGQSGYPAAPGGYPGQQSYPGQQGYGGQQAYPGGYPGQQGYPGYPGYPGGAGLPEAPVRPPTVMYAFWCWILVTVVYLVTLILVLNSAIWDAAVAAGLRQSGNTTLDIDPQSVVNLAKAVVIATFVVFAAIYLFFAFKMYAGRNWARIVLTVFGALGVLNALAPTSGSVTVNSQTFSAATTAPNWISVAVVVAAVVLMYLPQSNLYFKQSLAYRSARKLAGR